MRILVTGSNGMMGWGLRKATTDETMLWTHKDTLDVTNPRYISVYAEEKPDVIVHLAAETNHHAAEQNPARTYLINTIGAANMTALAMRLDIPIVYVGTCGIYDGSKSIYFTGDMPSPLNHYGRSKWYGEMCVRSYHKHYIMRCGWSMGGGEEIDCKFIGLVWQQIKAGAKEIFAITDVSGSPVYTPMFAKYMLNYLKKPFAYGKFNVAGRKATRFEVAEEFVRLLGVNVKVIGVTHAEYHKMFPCKTPYTKCEALGVPEDIAKQMDWKTGLAEYVRECYATLVRTK